MSPAAHPRGPGAQCTDAWVPVRGCHNGKMAEWVRAGGHRGHGDSQCHNGELVGSRGLSDIRGLRQETGAN